MSKQTMIRRSLVKKARGMTRKLQAQVKILEEEISALKVAAALEDGRMRMDGKENRWYHGQSRKAQLGRVYFPLPKGWLLDTNDGRPSVGAIEKHEQAYVEVFVLKLEE